MKLKKNLKRLMPDWLLSAYHLALAYLAAARYGFPSEKLVIIGITGTKGKTTTANFVWAALTGGGFKTGLIGTANIRIGEREEMNKYHMTMPGPMILQRYLAKMVEAGCTHAVFEVTSEGIKQWRHKGINYDYAVFTNLTPEHLPSHGGRFEKYKEAKGKLFAALAKGKRKTLNGRKLSKIAVINHDSPHADFFLSFPADKKITYGLGPGLDYSAENTFASPAGVAFSVNQENYVLRIVGEFNILNALPAIAIARLEGTEPEAIQRGFDSLTVIPGRMEKIDLGQPFTLFVDYAHEKESITAVLKTGRTLARNTGGRVIILLGAEGGGRDPAKRPIMGELSAKLADLAIVSNVDPYEDDPLAIAEDIATAAEKAGMVRGRDLFVILDRREGIRRALTAARPGDIVLITGKGAEQSIIIGGQSSPWDDRSVVKEELAKILSRSEPT